MHGAIRDLATPIGQSITEFARPSIQRAPLCLERTVEVIELAYFKRNAERIIPQEMASDFGKQSPIIERSEWRDPPIIPVQGQIEETLSSWADMNPPTFPP
jgi:hypothetical protein